MGELRAVAGGLILTQTNTSKKLYFRSHYSLRDSRVDNGLSSTCVNATPGEANR